MAKFELAGVKWRASHTNGSKRHSRRDQDQPAGLAIESIFCPTDVADPFDTVEWDLRTAAIKGESGELLFEQTRLRNPQVLEPARDECRRQQIFLRRDQHAAARAQRSAIDPSRQPHDRRLGPRGRLFRLGRRLRAVLSRTDLAGLHQHGAFNSPVWFNVGLFHQYGVKGSQCNWHWDAETRQRQAAGESVRISARLGLLHPKRATTTWKTSWSSPAARPCSSSSAPAPAPIYRRCVRIARSFPAADKPSGPLSFMRVYDQIAAVVKSGGKTRRAAKMQSLEGLASRHHGIHRVQGEGRAARPAS